VVVVVVVAAVAAVSVTFPVVDLPRLNQIFSAPASPNCPIKILTLVNSPVL
jgi:hypothetical protein